MAAVLSTDAERTGCVASRAYTASSSYSAHAGTSTCTRHATAAASRTMPSCLSGGQLLPQLTCRQLQHGWRRASARRTYGESCVRCLHAHDCVCHPWHMWHRRPSPLGAAHEAHACLKGNGLSPVGSLRARRRSREEVRKKVRGPGLHQKGAPGCG